ncbi:hypothetical protein GCM10022381_25530 [Leifsonia kafniensis]|uniref:Dihydrodipicolinate reductase n=2 Tax=Leifsonia kafniensis TaxID=475957 RepID=A0ABP7KPZ4_9MICO
MYAYAHDHGWVDRDRIRVHVVHRAAGAAHYATAVVGLGAQGSGIARRLNKLGHDVVAGVDIGDRVGKRIDELVPGFVGDGIVLGSVTELIAAHPDLDIVALAASVPLAVTRPWAAELTSHGINVVTLDHEAFAFDESWVPELDAAAKAGGASFMGVGVQDVAWLHLIRLASAAVADIRKITLTNIVPVEVLSLGLLEQIGLGNPADMGDDAQGGPDGGPDDLEGEGEQSVVAGPVREVARMFGATAGDMTLSFDPVVGDTDYYWIGGDRLIPAGTVQGIREVATCSTDRGFDIEGVVAVMPGGDEVSENIVEIEGESTLRVTFGPITTEVTDLALIARIPDIVRAAPGVRFSADMPSPRHHFGPSADDQHSPQREGASR